MTPEPLPVAAATEPTPATVEDSPTLCPHCQAPIDLTATGMIYRRRGVIVAIACVPCTDKRDRA